MPTLRYRERRNQVAHSTNQSSEFRRDVEYAIRSLRSRYGTDHTTLTKIRVFVQSMINPAQPTVAGELISFLGTYGNCFEGFETTDSLPMPSLIGVFDASVNITFGALSVKERPFQCSGHFYNAVQS